MALSTTIKNHVIGEIRGAFGKFLTLPLIVVVGFIVLNAIVFLTDSVWSDGHVVPGLRWLYLILGNDEALSSLLSTIASSIITVTSITFSLLLIAIQQGASSLSAQVTDQFLMRRTNQFYFGFFVGLSVFVLLTLVTASSNHRPVYGATISLLLTIAALVMIVVMIYNTIEQMRPAQIVHAIRGHVLRARDHERKLLEQTRRAPRTDWPVVSIVRAHDACHVTKINVGPLADLLRAARDGRLEAEIVAPVGTFAAFGDPMLVIRAAPGVVLSPDERSAIERQAEKAIVLDSGRDLKRDPSYGLYQLSTIGWTTISTAKSNPGPGHEVIHSLRDILSRWNAAPPPGEDARSPIVYPDRTPEEAYDALETVIVATSEAMQAQTVASAIQTLDLLLDQFSGRAADRIADIARRALSGLGEQVLTRELEAALDSLRATLERRGLNELAGCYETATRSLVQTLGRLNSRSTRVPSPA